MYIDSTDTLLYSNATSVNITDYSELPIKLFNELKAYDCQLCVLLKYSLADGQLICCNS